MIFNSLFLVYQLINSCRFERSQYIEVREGFNKDSGDFAGKSVGDTYGAEHLCRLIG